MLQSPLRGRRAIGVLAAFGALAAAAPASAAPFTTACKNSVEPNNYSQFDVTKMEATAPASVPPSTSFDVSGINGIVKVPGAVFATGYNLGLVKNGSTIDGTIQMVIEGVNTTQLSQTTPVVDVKIGPIVINDPDGNPGTGDESAPDVSVPFELPTETWTAAADEGQMTFRVVSVTPISPTKGGMLFTATIPNPDPSQPGFKVNFGCNPGTVDENQNPPNGVPSYVDFGAPFATPAIAKDAPPPPPPTNTPPPPTNPNPPTTGGDYPVNVFTFGKVKLNRKKGTAKLPINVPGEGVLRLSKGKVAGKVLRPSGAGRVILRIRARGKARKTLNRKGRLKIKVRVSFTPKNGTTLTKTKTIVLRKKHKKK